MNYLKPHMTKALRKHVLTVLLDTENVKVFHMARPNHSEFRVQITFTPGGITIQGDVGLGDAQNGICSRLGYGLEWFIRQQGESTYLCEKFLHKCWQREVVTHDLDSWVVQAREELETSVKEIMGADGMTHEEALNEARSERETLAAWEEIRAAWGDETSEKEIHEVGSDLITDFWDYSVGYDYPLADAGWLMAIQQRFAELFAEANQPPKHFLMIWKVADGHGGHEEYLGCTMARDEAEARANTTDTDHYEFREIDPAKCPVCQEEGGNASAR